MSKAVLVMEMPKRCEDCPLINVNYIQCYAQRLVPPGSYYKYDGLRVDRTTKPEWCPLHPLPEPNEGGHDMGRLTEKDDQGNWWLKGVRWQDLREGAVITRNTYEMIYGVLYKLLGYEETGLSPDQFEEILAEE